MLPPIFIVGCPRSGTTVLGNCLAAHPSLGGADESLFLRSLARMFSSQFHGVNRRGWAPLRSYIDEPELLNAMRSFTDRVFESLLDKLGKECYVDHTPWYVNYIPFMNLLYPAARFIHIIRDGRYVVNSLGHSYATGFKWAGHSTATRAALWNQTVSQGRKDGSFLGSERYCEVRYEELCRSPAPVLSSLLGFLGLSCEPDMFYPLARNHAAPSRHDVLLAQRDSLGQVHVIPRQLETGWPAGWTSDQMEDFRRVAGNLLHELGYE